MTGGTRKSKKLNMQVELESNASEMYLFSIAHSNQEGQCHFFALLKEPLGLQQQQEVMMAVRSSNVRYVSP